MTVTSYLHLARAGVSPRLSNLTHIVETGLRFYELRFERRRGGWAIQERLTSAVSADGRERSNRSSPWGCLGSLAATAYQAWQDVATNPNWAPEGTLLARFGLDAGFPERCRRRAALVRDLVAGRPMDSALQEELANLLHDRTTWLPPEIRRRELWLRIGVLAAPSEPFPVVAVYLSVVFGMRDRRLRECRSCQDPFVAARRVLKLCQPCYVLFRRLPRTKRLVLNRFKDWVRKLSPERRQRYYPDLENVTAIRHAASRDIVSSSLADWRRRWERPKGRGGRGRKTGGEP